MSDIEGAASAWLRPTRSTRLHPAARFVFLPHAGGAASFYLSWARGSFPEFDVRAAQYPGREDRLSEPCASDVSGVAAALAKELTRLSPPSVPLLLFGHSLGALCAYETARLLEHEHSVDVAHLFVSGRRAPSYPVTGDVHQRGDVELVAELERLGGIGTDVLRDPSVRGVFLPAIRADFRMAETYRHSSGPRLSCPLTAVIGTEDTEVDRAQAARWAEHTSGDFVLRSFPGGHFYLLAQQAAVHALITETTARST